MPLTTGKFKDKGVSKAAHELFNQGTKQPTEIWRQLKNKGIETSRSYILHLVQKWKKQAKTQAKTEKQKPEATTETSKTPEMTIEFKPIDVPEEIPSAEAVPTTPPTVGETAVAQGLISDEEMQGMVETVNSLSKNPRYQINEKAIPALAKAWSRVINKRLENVEDPNFDLYWVCAMTMMAALPPLMNWIMDRRKATVKPDTLAKPFKETEPMKERSTLALTKALEGAPEATMQPAGTSGYP